MKVLVVGGAGYIGSFVVRKLIEGNFEVLVVDNLSTGHKESVPASMLEVLDVTNQEALKEVFSTNSILAILHLANFSDPYDSFKKPYAYFRDNFLTTLNLLDCAREARVKKFIYASSYNIYGFPVNDPVYEDYPVDLRSVYAETKISCERLLGWYDLLYGVRSVVLRLASVGGASLDGNMGEDKKDCLGIVSQISKASMTDGVFRIPGVDFETNDGTFIRDYIHVEDVAEAFIKALKFLTTSPKSDVFNIGGGKGYSVKELCALAEEQTGKALNLVPLNSKRIDPPKIVTSNSKAYDMLSWSPKYSIKDLIETSVYFWAKHPEGLN
ncbi:MAG: UDP-glucose 4-epimerase GalE [Patescibacteria group bacterium]